MNAQQARQWIERLFSEVWTNLDESKLHEFYHPDLVAHFGKQTADFQDVVNRLHFVKKRYHRLISTIHDVMAEGDKIAVRLSQHYGDETKSYSLIAIYQLREGKASHAWACVDPMINYFEH